MSKLNSLFTRIPVQLISAEPLPAVEITGIAFDSREVKPGYVFIPLVGQAVDGHRFIADAVKRGAAAVVGSKPLVEDIGVPYVQVADTRVALAYISAAFYGFPAHQMTMIGVTGTDGKTTTISLIYQIMLKARLRAGMISTVNAVIGDQTIDTGFHVTTPEAPDVQRYLSQMVAAGLTHVALEATSHGLAQERVTGCEFDIGVVTNITHEHLDYHGSYQNYLAAKARLLTGLKDTPEKPGGNIRLAVLNRDDQSFEALDALVNVRKATYSLQQPADVTAENIRYLPTGTEFTARIQNERIPIKTNLVGAFNLSNTLAAIAATTIGLGVPPEAVQEGLLALKGIPGRMEVIDYGQNFTAIIDFAHTPNALKRALETVRSFSSGRILAVFGSAGLRDREKRRLMAEVSVKLADVTILTAEDPRTESLDDILAEMAAAGIKAGGVEGKSLFRVPDRGEAIRTALKMAQPGDVVISCGKGHEQSMCFGDIEYDWDDRTALRAALSEYMGVSGPKMPYLPTQG